MANSLRPSPLSFPSTDSARQSPFRRQNSHSPATVRAATPTSSPTKAPSNLSPAKPFAREASLSPEKGSPFVRRPSQNSQASDRPASPFARPSSSLSVPLSPSRSPSRQGSHGSKSEETPVASPVRKPSSSAADAETPKQHYQPPSVRSPELERATSLPSPNKLDPADQYDGLRSPSVAPDSPTTTAIPSQANLRPALPRTVTGSTTSTIRQPVFTAAATESTPASNPHAASRSPATTNAGYNHLPQPLLRSMRESFEVLDSANAGTVTAASLIPMLEQLGLDASPASLQAFFPPSCPAQLNLARYLDTLSSPLASLSQAEELLAAFGAFDVDDSGQLDLAELRDALLHTAPEPREQQGVQRLGEREVEGILGEFAGRRAFGAKGMGGARGKGEVFRYREFMAGISGGGAEAVQAREAGVVS